MREVALYVGTDTNLGLDNAIQPNSSINLTCNVDFFGNMWDWCDCIMS